MAPRKNPLKLNTLQLKTLTVLQALARDPETSSHDEDSGGVDITRLPSPHGDHFHIAGAIVMASDATGLFNKSVWNALQRKGLIDAQWPSAIRLMPEGLAYNTNLSDKILHHHEH